MTTWFTSDTHFGHGNIIKYCDRPFQHKEEMDREMTRRWNTVVQPRDEVFHLGDFSFHKVEKSKHILNQLNGKKYLVLGNHDKSRKTMEEMGWEVICEKNEHIPHPFTTLDGKLITAQLAHNPEHLNTEGNYNLYLCGHVHEKWVRRGKIINVGVDQWVFAPVSLEELLKLNEVEYV